MPRMMRSPRPGALTKISGSRTVPGSGQKARRAGAVYIIPNAFGSQIDSGGQ
jgi:hypothetical protein